MNKAAMRVAVAIGAVWLGFVGNSLAGNTNSLGAPTDPASAMFTLNDIYNVMYTRTTNVTLRGGQTAFVEPTSGPTGTMHTLNEIMTLVTNRPPVTKTGQTNSFAVGDDGTYQKGGSWPIPRFTIGTGTVVNTTNCVTDNLTGLMWARNANIASNSVWGLDGKMTWANAFNVITNMSTGLVNRVSYGGYSDWRLPNARELYSLIHYQYYRPALCNTAGTNQWVENDPFTGVQYGNGVLYWSGTTRMSSTAYAMSLELAVGSIATGGAKTDMWYVWPVRGGQ